MMASEYSFQPPRRTRRAFTLVEIMVVLVIVMILAGMILVAARPAIEERRMREAGRSVSTMLYQAKARAVESGRPFGVWMEVARNGEGQSSVSRVLYFAETPPIYAGDATDSRAEIKEGGNATLIGCNTSLIEEGDFIRFNYQDPIYRITTAGSQVQFGPTTPGVALPKPQEGTSMSVPFQILRKPRKAIGAPLQLTGNLVIDLTQSGIGATGVDFNQSGSRQVIIMFSPNGNIDRVYTDDKTSRVPTSPVHLLIGKNDKVGGENLQERLNLWVSVGNQTGLVATSPNVASQNGGLKEARQLATSMQGMGGR